MSNFQITYKYPWLLLLIIPAVLLTLIPYFRLGKKHRFTRNKILSMTLHITAMLLAINLLAGIAFSYEVPNEDNEVILLVDVSDSTEGMSDRIDEFVRSAIDAAPEGCRIGIVKFGYGHEYSVELTANKEGVFEKYAASERPDGSASSLAAALKYTSGLFTSTESAKIVIVSDGIETDGDARLALYDIVSEGITVDSAHIADEDVRDIQILSAEIVDEDIMPGEIFSVKLVIASSSTESEGAAILRLYDNGEPCGETPVGIKNGENEITVSLSLDEREIHELTFELVTDHELFGEPLDDELGENNVYRTYINLEELENVLIIERYEGESAALKSIISTTKTVRDISIEADAAEIPTSIVEMARYEQIILVNISYSDMPEGFEECLHRYVYDLGGGLFTVGGRNEQGADGKPVPHAYNRADIEKSTYFKNMLPVSAEDYTPPVAVMLVIDTSLSMKSTGKLAAAIEGAGVCLDALGDRDYCGIVSFSSASSERLSVLPVSQRETIAETIKRLEDDAGGGTIFSDAIMKSGNALSVIENVERKHIVLITDGKPADSYDDYERYIKYNTENGITMSVMTIGIDDPRKAVEMQKAAAAGGGKYYGVSDAGSLSGTMYKDLTEEAIPEIAYGEKFAITAKDRSPILAGIDPSLIPALRGYYGTVAKKDATVPLMGKYVPIYVVHKYGAGKVGSFMSDVGGEWSDEFAQSVVGRAIIMNIVESLFPSSDVRADEIKYELKADNYLHSVNIHGAPSGEEISVTVNPYSPHLQHLYGEIEVTAAESNRRFTFTLSEPGLYEILITSTDEAGETVTEIPVYRTFSYSEEYDTHSHTGKEGESLMAELAKVGGGLAVDDPARIFTSLSETVTLEYDPRFVMIIVAIVLFLLDVAVRKFKFKWPHELIAEGSRTNKS